LWSSLVVKDGKSPQASRDCGNGPEEPMPRPATGMRQCTVEADRNPYSIVHFRLTRFSEKIADGPQDFLKRRKWRVFCHSQERAFDPMSQKVGNSRFANKIHALASVATE